MKNTLQDLNNHLFAQLERLSDEDLSDEKLNTEIKIALPNKWVRKHIYLYEKAHGKVPKGHVIIFADKDRSNFNLDNLICVSRSELAVINKNKLVYPNGEFTKVGVNIAKVKMAISRRNNGKE